MDREHAGDALSPSAMRELHGVLVIDKPAALSSANVVARARRALRAVGARKAGHTGTLDPLATGVLPLVLGEACKLAPYLLADDKAYEAELVLGVETATQDAHGGVIARAPEAAARVTEADLRAALAGFTGAIEQVPPMYSAIMHEGQRLHELARDGVEIDRAPRAVTIYRLELLSFTPPRARIAIDCSKGTYVRTLVADLGRALGSGAHLAALRRTRAGVFTLEHAVTLPDLEADPAIAATHLIPPARVLGFPEVVAAALHHRDVHNGIVPAEIAEAAGKLPESDFIQLVAPNGDLIAIATRAGGKIELVRVFTYGLTPEPRSSKVPASS